jgi:hypothetical protein
MPGNSEVGENGEITARPIKPYRCFVPGRLPKTIADTFKLHWRPLFTMMEEGLDDIPQDPSAETIDALYAQATEHLKTRAGFVFQNTRLNPQNWTISTWAKNVKRSMIVSKGTAQDKANLPDENRFNRGHTGRKRRVNLQHQTRVPRRRNQVPPAIPPVPPATIPRTTIPTIPRTTIPRTTIPARAIPPTRARAVPPARRAVAAAAARRSNDSDTDSDTSSSSDDETTSGRRKKRQNKNDETNDDRGFENAFELTILSGAAQARSREVERQVQREMEEEDRKMTVDESNRRRRNNANELTIHKKMGRKNKGVTDAGYVSWLQDKIQNNESSDDSASS